jgi:hypothetical protein
MLGGGKKGLLTQRATEKNLIRLRVFCRLQGFSLFSLFSVFSVLKSVVSDSSGDRRIGVAIIRGRQFFQVCRIEKMPAGRRRYKISQVL